AIAYRVGREVKTLRSSPSMAGAAATPSSSMQPAGNNPLTPADISGAIQRAQAAAGNKLTSAQVASLNAALADPNQQLITRGTNWSPVRAAMVNPDDSAYVYFSGGLVTLDAQGQITSTTINKSAIASIDIPLWTCAVAGADGILSVLLAVMLFMGAISVMRNGRNGRRLHLLYACVKIPLAIAGGWAMATVSSRFWSSMMAQGTPGGGAEAGHQVFVFVALAFCGGGLVYPIVLLIAMNTRGVRNFYRVVS
ncbi:MAG TPA: hypothetical protein VFE47_22815, partial [Tepidisphaeraceae bacterium]|nr:hypothetical protein [Tepidisphaeraceae bacterium]